MKFLKDSIKAICLFSVIALSIVACKKEVSTPITTPQTSTQNSFFDLSDNLQDSLDSFDFECFTINYPIVIVYPDGSTQSVNSDLELETAVETYYTANPNGDDPTLSFPVNITLEDGTVVIVNDEEEICDIVLDCYPDLDEYDFDEDDYDDDDYDCIDFDDCFTFNYPVTLVLPDGTNVGVSSDSLLISAVDDYYTQNPTDDNDPTLIYPVTVTLEDSTTMTLNNDDDLEDLIDDCED